WSLSSGRRSRTRGTTTASAALRILRRAAACRLSAAVQDRRSQAELGDPGAVGQTAAPGVAARSYRAAGRQWLLPAAALGLVRTAGGRLHPGFGQDPAAGGPGRAVARRRQGRLRRDR